MLDLAVVHVVRAAYGPDRLRGFLEAYDAHPAGVAHRLVLAFKGFDRGSLPPAFDLLVRGRDAVHLHFPDVGFDIGTYHNVWTTLGANAFCLLNSGARPRVADWLRLLAEPVAHDSVGAVSATGSWESKRHNIALREAEFAEHPALTRVARAVWYRWLAFHLGRHYPPFPNPHLRTNALVIRRSVLQIVRVGAMRTKNDTLRFESGNASLTRQLARSGLETLVTGVDGRTYQPLDWRQSETFRVGAQRNLVVHDVQTDAYASASEAKRAKVRLAVWGRADDLEDSGASGTR